MYPHTLKHFRPAYKWRGEARRVLMSCQVVGAHGLFGFGHFPKAKMCVLPLTLTHTYIHNVNSTHLRSNKHIHCHFTLAFDSRNFGALRLFFVIWLDRMAFWCFTLKFLLVLLILFKLTDRPPWKKNRIHSMLTKIKIKLLVVRVKMLFFGSLNIYKANSYNS